MVTSENIKYTFVKEPFWGLPENEPVLPEEVYQGRLSRTLAAMDEHKLDYLLFYADREHFSNFDYLTGFGPRFEEGILVLDKAGKAYILLGNECYKMYRYSRIPAEGILYQALSLPNQPIDFYKDLSQILSEIGITSSDKIGVIGWKLIYPVYGSRYMFDIPSFIAESIISIAGKENVINVTDLFIHPGYGIRIINNADEIASFEFGATYASDSVQQMLLHVRTGMNELEVSKYMTCGALPTACFPKVLSGARIDIGMISPTTNEIKLGDRFQVSVGLRGGLTCRKGFVAYSNNDLPGIAEDYLEKVAAPYYAAVVNWYEKIGIGVSGGDIYDMIEANYSKAKYGWKLNPGHLIATEEWLSSPIFKDSRITVKSGMCVQMDIIPSTERHYVAPNCEDGIAIADEELRREIAKKYPEAYRRMENRRNFMINVLNIKLKPEVLPLSNLAGLYRPYVLDRDRAFIVER